eukprot:scpid66068/ scgid2047/ Vinculin
MLPTPSKAVSLSSKPSGFLLLMFQIHMISILVDEMTSELGTPMDRLAGAALAVSKCTAEERVQRIKVLRFQEEDIKQRAKRVLTKVKKFASVSKDRVRSHEANSCAQSLSQTVPLLVKAAHCIADQPDRLAVQQFQHARRCWVAKTAHLSALLKNMADSDPELAADIQDDVLGVSDVSEEEAELAEDQQLDLNNEFGDDSMLSPIPGDRQQRNESGVFSPPRMDQITSTPHHKSKQHTLPDIDEDASLDMTQQSENYSVASASTWLDDQADQPPTSRSIIIAARTLHDEASKFDEESNSLVRLAKNMSQQMYQMAQFTRRKGPIQSKSEMIDMARKIAMDSGAVVRYAQHMAEQTTDWRMRAELLDCAEVIPTFSTQLSILASVKSAASSPRDRDTSADAMLVKNAQNLMQTVMRAMRASQAACMKGLQEPGETDDTMSAETREMALLWKRQLKQRRSLEKDIAPIGSRGLRRFSRNPNVSSLAELSLTH